MDPSKELPADYEPFDTLIICGNAFIHGRVPLEVSGHYPFLVGKGPGATVWLWLSMPTSPKMTEWRLLVEKSISRNSFISSGAVSGGLFEIQLRGQTVISVSRESETQAAILKLDLRPIGLRVHGDTNGLIMGTNSFVNNTFTNVNTMVSIAA